MSLEQVRQKHKEALEQQPKKIGDFDSRLNYFEYLFERTKLDLRFNILTQKIELNSQAITYDQLRRKIANEFGYDLPINERGAIYSLLSETKEYNPITNYLDNLNHAKKSPYEHIANAFGFEPDSFDTKLIVLTLLGAVNRAYKPGCKMQTVLIFLSGQGKYKSTFWESIVPDETLYVEPTDASQEKHYLMSCYSSWLVNMSEIETMFSKKSISDNKAFITKQRDTFVPPYGHDAITYSRHWILVGSTNEDELFRDYENRRYWVVKLKDDKPINNEYVLANRDDIWAGILELYMADTQYWFDDGSADANLLKEQNLEYREQQPFVERLNLFLDAIGLEPFSLTYCYKACFDCFAEQDKKKQKQLANELRALGYQPIRTTVDGKQQRVWIKS